MINDEPQMNRRISNGDEADCTTKLTCTITHNEGFRRKKSASLNSPANSGTQKTNFKTFTNYNYNQRNNNDCYAFF